MLKKTLALAAVTTALLLQAAPGKATPPSCSDQCLSSYQTCPIMCQLSPSDCHTYYLTCLSGCAQYNQAWLIC
jgi:hypothetical protein